MKVKPPTYNPKPPLSWPYILVSAAFAVVLGFALMLGWLEVLWSVLIGWVLLTTLWVFLVNYGERKRPFAHLFWIAFIGGFIAGSIPFMFHTQYVANNAEVKKDLGNTITAIEKLQVLYLNVLYGTVFGLVGGFAGDQLANRRELNKPPDAAAGP